ncbi:hypothetical protein ACE1CI_14070 [Aerosakkonemataceae cyanobacterium BLCC-F50]|uniref:Uncharacterized protein n=1 Tax=Floridaenema flaviceps BLCC-F50 TaxID=3153642 RepID=A0ABV4XSH6_9CYAN
MRKKTHADVEAKFAAEGYRLLSQYEQAHGKMQVICPVGHEVLMTWSHFNNGKRCPECAKVTQANKRRTPENVVRKAFEDAGYQLLAERYENNMTRMDCICPEGHQIKMDWASFQNGVRCNECAKLKRGKTRKRNTAAKAISAFAAEGYQLLDEYTDSHTLMRFICPQGHEHQISWTNFDSGYRCTYCAKAAPVTQERVQQSFEAEGYQLLDKYRSKKRRLRFICPKGHKYSISWDNWNSGTRCAICTGRVVTRKQVKDAFKAEGYTLLTPYKRDNTQKLDFICPKGHDHSITWADFQAGCRCSLCNKPFVNPEIVKEFFISAGYTPLSEYQKSDDKIPYICPKGHQHSITWNSFKNGCRCPECQGKIVRHEDVELAFAADGYELLDNYKNSRTYMKYICPEGHQHSIIWDAFKQGVRCPYCAGMKPSQEQLEINAIKKGVAGLIYIYLKRQEAQKPFSITSFAAKVAEKIHKKLGVRPNGHHLDHIIPQRFFDFRQQSEIEACWDIDNLRWLTAIENIIKGGRLTIQDIETFSLKQLQLLAKASRRPNTFNSILLSKKIID